jgi:hypothetical protein
MKKVINKRNEIKKSIKINSKKYLAKFYSIKENVGK